MPKMEEGMPCHFIREGQEAGALRLYKQYMWKKDGRLRHRPIYPNDLRPIIRRRADGPQRRFV
ncbi:hypothetical protein ET33_31655 [Paenibacillus tyrfis]|uniref:Uncharacterized protein n=1 Tax=Paenibacillus tyrfis TaxID=1501230 RepID=A0A081P6U1_9BACL|nr:hypothetical protein ET33_31655 [Paenibacillus tyrfis]